MKSKNKDLDVVVYELHLLSLLPVEYYFISYMALYKMFQFIS